MALLAGLFALVLGAAWSHHLHQLAQLVAAAAPVAFIGAGGPSFGGPPSTFLNDTWRPTSGRSLVVGSSFTVTATTTSVQDFSIAGTCLYQGVDCATAFGGGGASSDPITAAHWSSTSGTDTMTTTAIASSNLAFAGLGGLRLAQIQGVGGQTVTASDTGVRADITDVTGTLIQVGGLTWVKSAFCTWGLGVASDEFTQVAVGGDACSLVDTGVSDGFVQATLNDAQGWNNTGVLFRWDPVANSGFNLLYFNDGKYYLNRYTAGSAFTVFNGFCHTAPNPGNVMRASYVGSTISISCNGATIGTVTDTNFTGNTFAGMAFLSGQNAERLTDFSTGIGASQSLVVSPLNSTTIFEESFQTWRVDHDETVAGSSTLHAVSATTIAASGQITSTVATGTAPLVIASTTKCTNLNADLLDGVDASAFYQSGDSPNFNVVTANTVQIPVQLGLDDHPRGICGAGREGDINYDSGHFYGCDGLTWLQLDN